MTKVLLGKFKLEGTCVMVGDPYYLPTENGDYEYLTYEKFRDAWATCESNFKSLYDGLANFIEVKYGPGDYPIYGYLNDEGNVVQILIDFQGEKE